MICKDCIHNGVCYLQEATNDIDEHLKEFGCKDFKNKADFVEITKVAEIFEEQFGDKYPCNFNDNDEWLPYVCERCAICDCPPANNCWEQLIKQYDKREEILDDH